MSDASNVDVILGQAREREKEYEWLGAVDFFQKALGSVPETDFLKTGQIHEGIGYAFYRAALQAEGQEEFGERMRSAVSNYERAKGFYERSSESRKKPRVFRCRAMIAFINHWLAPQAAEKKRLLDESWSLANQSLKAFEDAGDASEYGRTFNQLSSSAVLSFTREWDFQARVKTMREATEHGDRAITFLSGFGDLYELAGAYARALVCMGVFAYYCLDGDERESYFQKGLRYWQRAKELSEETAMVESVYPVYGSHILLGEEGTEEALANYRKALEYARKTKDKFSIGCALDWLAYHSFWKSRGIEDPDEAKVLVKTALQHSEDAARQFAKISFTCPRGDLLWVEAPYPDYYTAMISFETSLEKKRELLEKAMEAAKDEAIRVKDSGYPELAMMGEGELSTVLMGFAEMERSPEEKKRLLEKALEHLNRAGEICLQVEPYLYWNLGVGMSGRGKIKSELADLVKDPEAKKNLLQEAVETKEKAKELCLKELTFLERKPGPTPSLYAPLGMGLYEYGDLLNRLHKLTGDKEYLRRAARAFEEAAESYQKLDLTSRMAECYWKTALMHDDLGEHLKSAENFDRASSNYRSAVEKVPQLKDFYENHVLYMQAWSEIEKARHHHSRQEYGSAKEHFEKAAGLHQSLKQWSYLASNYSAWARIEHAEDLSRREQCEEAVEAFEHAARLFGETKKSIQTKLGDIEDADEKLMATSLVKVSELRREYCVARICLEEAKILDKKGDHYSSSEKYGSAVSSFERIMQALESQQDRKELNLILTLSKAWQKMTQAEAEASPALYLEASRLFEEAKELSSTEKAKMLALGHSRFCLALDAGTRLADTRDVALHSTATKHLESAANYYVKAGFQNSSEYAKATELLLDAYMHMDNAKRETDPEKKVRFFMMTEKVLQTSAGSFMKAEHPEKREQVLKLLEKVKEERELALSLSEVLHAPSIVSTTSAFASPAPTQEDAVGLERFEHADIQANVITRRKELKVGEDLDLEIELVNAGKSPALLVKLAEIVPEGFELTEKPEIYRAEDSFLNMKGKRLDPLKTEEVRIVLKPKVQGDFKLKPKILYLDENGKYQSHEPEPVAIKVKELGIKGWIKGER